MQDVQDGGVGGYMTVMFYHVGNRSKTRWNLIFCDKGPDVMVGNVWKLF